MSTTSLIKITNFQKEYGKTNVIVHDQIIKQGVTLIIGENGSGKSTLFKAITGLITYLGNIELTCSYSYMPEVVTFPQDVTVNEFLTKLATLETNETSFLDLVITFDLETKLEEKIHNLSKGMNGKLNLIQCLMADKELYILDEPLNGLDYDSVKKLVTYIKASQKSFLISSHITDAFKELDKEVIKL